MNVTIMSGPPGAGKSYQANSLAAKLLADGEDGVIVSADHFWSPDLNEACGRESYRGVTFYQMENIAVQEALKVYNFEPGPKLSEAHKECMAAYIACLQLGVPQIIVDNTNIYSHEIAPYYLVGEALGYEVEIYRVTADLEVCKTRNTHDVPANTIERMHKVHSEMTPHPWIPGVEMPAQHMPWWTTI